MDVSTKVPSGLMFLVICNPTIKNILSYLILSYHAIPLHCYIQISIVFSVPQIEYPPGGSGKKVVMLTSCW